MHFLLIHGSWHGAWCWHKITARLQTAGHHVIVPDLPGRGSDRTRPIFISTKMMLARLLKVLPADEQVTVVVHSRYGVLASQLCEIAPDRIARVIYLASFMMPSGKAVIHYASKDKASSIGNFTDINRLGAWDWLRPEAHRELLYHDCQEDDVVLAASLLRREPSRPAITALRLSDDAYGRIPRAYIRLTKDRAVSLSMQDRLINEVGVDRVESIDAGHSAYFSKPDELTAAISKLADS